MFLTYYFNSVVLEQPHLRNMITFMELLLFESPSNAFSFLSNVSQGHSELKSLQFHIGTCIFHENGIWNWKDTCNFRLFLSTKVFQMYFFEKQHFVLLLDDHFTINYY